MAKILKDIYVSWTWEGDEMLLEGFNVAIAPQGSDPKTEAIIIQKTSSEKTDILNRGTTQYEHIFRNVTLNKDTNYIAWVQSLTDGFDSEWLSATGITVSDDGKATIATTDADGNPITSSGGDVTIDSAGITVVNGAFKLVNSSGSITIDNTGITANDGSKDTFKIDSNGNASFSGSINVGSNIAGVDTSAEDLETVSGSTSKSTTAETNAKKYAKAYTDDLETSLGNLAFDNLVEKAKLGSTIIDGGYIKSDLLTADNIITGRLGANRVQIGGGTTYESGYDPTTKETPSGAQSKADTAETNAKKYADDDSKWVASNSREDANISSAGWYRIAMNTGNRAHATFKLRDTQSGQHNTVEFKLGCSYNRVSTADFQMTTFSRYGSLTFSKVRLLTNGTYDEMYVEVYLNSSASVRCEITDNIQSSGWQSVGWTSGSIPSGYSSTEWDIDVNTITIDGNGIKTTGANGNYSLLTDDQLAFYEAGSSTPHWYSKNVAYGTAQDGDYIQLDWDKPPKVQTAIKSLMSYNSGYSGNNQYYESFPSAISKDGFYVNGFSKVPGAWETFDAGGSNLTIPWTSAYTSRTNVTRLKTQFHFFAGDSNNPYYSYDYTVKYQKNGGNWVTYTTFYSDNNPVTTMYFTVDIPNLSPGQYRLQIAISENGLTVDYCNSVGETVIDNGEVMWIAIEGGAD